MNNQIEKQLLDARNQLLLNELLIVKSANEHMNEAAKLPPIKKIFGTFIFAGETTFIVGDTGLGKSLFGVEIANAISKNQRILFDQEIEFQLGPGETVLLFDFELSKRQFFKRYENYNFSSKFIRAELNPLYMGNDYLTFDYLRRTIESVNAKLVILDNISALSLQSTQDANIAIKIMRELHKISINGVSIIVIAHIPKVPKNVPLTIDHLAGSSYLSRFIDGQFFLAQSSQNPDYRYIKQVKTRNAEKMKDVLVISIGKKDNFLGFQMVGYDCENNHLSAKEETNDEKYAEQLEQILLYHKQGKSFREIENLTGIPKSTVYRMIKNHVPPTDKNGTDGTDGTPNGTPPDPNSPSNSG